MKNKKIFDNKEELALFFAEYLVARVLETPSGEFFTWALSGGSTPKYIFNFLAERFRSKINWEKVKVFWGDERCVSPDNSESNYKMADENLLSHILIPEQNIFRMFGEAEPVVETKRYADLLNNHLKKVNSVPSFDLLTLGLGNDGHIASIFPPFADVFNSDNLVEATLNPYTGQKRLTITGKLINNARNIYVLVTGAEKKQIVKLLMQEQKEWMKLPAAKVDPHNGQLQWLLDKQAASIL